MTTPLEQVHKLPKPFTEQVNSKTQTNHTYRIRIAAPYVDPIANVKDLKVVKEETPPFVDSSCQIKPCIPRIKCYACDTRSDKKDLFFDKLMFCDCGLKFKDCKSFQTSFKTTDCPLKNIAWSTSKAPINSLEKNLSNKYKENKVYLRHKSPLNVVIPEIRNKVIEETVNRIITESIQESVKIRITESVKESKDFRIPELFKESVNFRTTNHTSRIIIAAPFVEPEVNVKDLSQSKKV